MAQELRHGEILQLLLLRFIKKLREFQWIASVWLSEILDTPSSNHPNPFSSYAQLKKMFPPKQNLWFQKMYPASLYHSWKEFSMVVKHLPSSVMKPDSRNEQTFVSTRLMLPPIVNSVFITWLARKKTKIEGTQSFTRDWLVQNEKPAEML